MFYSDWVKFLVNLEKLFVIFFLVESGCLGFLLLLFLFCFGEGVVEREKVLEN